MAETVVPIRCPRPDREGPGGRSRGRLDADQAHQSRAVGVVSKLGVQKEGIVEEPEVQVRVEGAQVIL